MIDKNRKQKTKHVVSKITFIFIGVLMVFHILWLLIPIAWGVMSSFKDIYDFSVNPFSFPDTFHWENYPFAFNKLEAEVWITSTNKLVVFKYFNMFWNSIIYAVLAPACNLFVTFCTAYVIARYRFTGRNFIYNFAVLMMVLPFSASLAASLYLHKSLGIYDNMALFIVSGASGFGFNFILLHGNIKSMTNSFGEAAQIDGAGHYAIMFRIYFPMVFPLVFGLFLLGFIASWNDYRTFLVYLPSTPNLAYGTYAFDQFSTSKRYSTPQIMAAFMLLALPTIIFWSACHKWTMQTMKVGGLKG